MKIGKIDKATIVTMTKAVERRLDIEAGANFNRHRVHKSKKAYNRKQAKRINYADI